MPPKPEGSTSLPPMTSHDSSRSLKITRDALERLYSKHPTTTLYSLLVDGIKEPKLLDYLSQKPEKRIEHSEEYTEEKLKRKRKSHQRHVKRQKTQRAIFLSFLHQTVVVFPVTHYNPDSTPAVELISAALLEFGESVTSRSLSRLSKKETLQQRLVDRIVADLHRGPLSRITINLPTLYKPIKSLSYDKPHKNNILTCHIKNNEDGEIGHNLFDQFFNTTLSHVATHKSWKQLNSYTRPGTIYFLLAYCSVFCNTGISGEPSTTVLQVAGPSYEHLHPPPSLNINNEPKSFSGEILPVLIANSARISFKKRSVIRKKPYIFNKKVRFGFNPHRMSTFPNYKFISNFFKIF